MTTPAPDDDASNDRTRRPLPALGALVLVLVLGIGLAALVGTSVFGLAGASRRGR